MTLVRAERLYKVFGPRPEQALARLRDNASHEQLPEGTTAAVVDASFSVREGETFVVMGLSGSGKSTLIRMLNGLLSPTSGHVYADDEDITAMSGKALRTMRQRTMSMVFQHFALLPHRSVLDNVGYGLRVQRAEPSEIQRRAAEALTLVGLEGWEQRYPQQLSGGMRQRVGLARALAAGNDVLLMDEAFSALDPLIRREMQDQLVLLQSQLSKTIIFITHDLNEAMRLGDRIAVMRAGRIVQVGTSEQILNKPADDYVAQFVRDVDRSRVLTADAVANRQAPTIAPESSPNDALARMRQGQTDRLFVSDGQQRLVGILSDTAVEQAIQAGHNHVHEALTSVDEAIPHSTPVHELFPRMAGSTRALPVVDPRHRLIGVIAAEDLFAALSNQKALRSDTPSNARSAESTSEATNTASNQEGRPSDA